MKQIANFFRRAEGKTVAVVASMAATSPVLAQGTYDSLTTAVDWSDVAAGLLAVGAAIIGIMVTFKGIKLITRAVKSA